jgi:hypothetical protein
VCVAAVPAVRQVQGRGLLLQGVPTLTLLQHIWFRSVTEIDKIGRERERQNERGRCRERGVDARFKCHKNYSKRILGGKTAQRERGGGVEGTGAGREGRRKGGGGQGRCD